jgi:SAM-dependent methyltransferase
VDLGCGSGIRAARLSRAGLAQLFRRIYRALQPGGILVFDVREPGSPRGAPLTRGFQGGDWAVMMEVRESRSGRRLTRHITSFRRIGRTYRRSDETHRLRLHRRSKIAAELRRAGFRIRSLRGYGRRRFPPGVAGFWRASPWVAPGAGATTGGWNE